MIWTILALALWVVLGGFISYYGDLQGRRWGKKRVSWFGLRPKHTAILITSLTGGVIALFSVLSLMIIAPKVRDVVLQGAQAIQENRDLIAAQKKQQIEQKALDLAQKHKQEHDTEVARLAQIDNNARKAAGQRELAGLNSRLRAAQAQLLPLQARVNTLLSKAAVLESKSKTLRKDNQTLTTATANSAIINEQLGKQNVEFSHQNSDLVKQVKVHEAEVKQLENKYTFLLNQQKSLISSNDSFYNESKRLQQEREDLKQRIAELKHDRDEALDLIQQRDQLYSQIDKLSQLIASKYSSLRQGRVVLRAGVELGRVSLVAHLRYDAVKKQLADALTTASDNARRFGAAPDDSGKAALLVPHLSPTLTGNEVHDENQQLDEFANDWSGKDQTYVIVASTVSNCLAGEPAYIELHQYKVFRVFAKGTAVASKTIDGHSSIDDITNNLMSFLQKDVKTAALKAGTIPIVEPESGAAEVGVLGTGELFKLMDQVRKIHGPVLLTARAKQDLSSADRLNLTFHVSRIPTQAAAVAAD